MKTIFTIVFSLFVLFSVGEEKENKSPLPAKENAVMVVGNVSDEDTGEKLVGVEVKLEGTTKKAYTDFDGNFVFEEVMPGEYSISASYISYEKQKTKKQTIDIFTSELAVKLKPLH